MTAILAPEWTQEDLLGVFDRSPEAWKREFVLLVARFADAMTPFSADDLRDAGLWEPDQPNRWGAGFRAQERAGVIESWGFAVSRRVERHGSVLRRWIGVAR